MSKDEAKKTPRKKTVGKKGRDVEAVVAASHFDPHHLLGAHVHELGVVVRTLRPGASAAHLHTGKKEIAFNHLGDDLFECLVPKAKLPLAYTIEVNYPDGTTITEPDAYSFPPSIGELDLHLFGEGRHEHLGEVLGARQCEMNGVDGTAFTVWAPSARAVSIVGAFNLWNERSHQMRSLGSSGVWELFVPGVGSGITYKFAILAQDGQRRLKADPFARSAEVPPRTASVVWDSKFSWSDEQWLSNRRSAQPWREPMSIYEMHLGSWRPGLNYVELAHELGDYVVDLGFTHVELMPVMEHPFSGSWGYQVTGFYAPTSRFGNPDEFRHFVDILHDRGVGVILDWVPAHFPRDEWALAQFDGTALYEHEDERRGAHPDWGTLIFNQGRHEVRNFLVASANNWLSKFHCDGLRVDAVASMLYLDYSRNAGEWIPNKFGGREDLDAISFLQELNAVAHREQPGTIMVAEESTAWPGVSRPTSEGGLGFGFKWNMGWMHDTLDYFSHEPIHRRYHHHDLTFSLLYAFSEHFILPLSHDEVVHGKGSILSKMPGDRWQQLANLRALYGYMWAHPGKQLLFMGSEFAQENEWNSDGSLDWHLLEKEDHLGVQKLVRDLNAAYLGQSALWLRDSDPGGFSWIDSNNADDNVIAFVRRGDDERDVVVCICNLSPVPRQHFRIGVPFAGPWRELINTDSVFYGGSNVGNNGWVESSAKPAHGHANSIMLNLPPLATLWLTPQGQGSSST